MMAGPRERTKIYIPAIVDNSMLLPITGQISPFAFGDDGSSRAGKDHQFVVVGNLAYDYSTHLCWVLNPTFIIPGGSGSIVPVGCGTFVGDVGYYNYGDVVQGNGTPDSNYYVCIQTYDVLTYPEAIPGTEGGTAFWAPDPWVASASSTLTPATMTWANAVANSLLTYAGVGPWSLSNLNGWRLSNPNELGSLRQFGVGWPSIVEPFLSQSNIQKANYWTSTTYRSNENCAWISNFDIGVQTNITAKTVGCYVLPVHSF